MVLLVACLSVALFVLAFWSTAIANQAGQIINLAKQSVSTMQDDQLSDAVKEKMIQSASVSLFKLAFKLIVSFLLVIVASYLPIITFDYFRIVAQSESISFLLSWQFILSSCMLVLATAFVWKQLR